jgi:hypothetical protein
MRLLFVENRYVTWLWERIAAGLAADGHEIHWLVQNPSFAPAAANVHVLPFPRAGEHGNELEAEQHPLLRRDRTRRYFGMTAAQQGAYWSAIDARLDAIAPDVVFGEPTQFHELITIELARRRNIPYLYSSATRYPTGRTVFHAYDTIETLGGSGDVLSPAEAQRMREDVVNRRVVPTYMAARRTTPARRIWRHWRDRARVTTGWLGGERFVTPSPLRKLRLEVRRRAMTRRWDALAASTLPAGHAGRPWALYAMQMQPESNIDVWGNPWSDQTRIIREAADALAGMGGFLVVKPNPKSKYEITRPLCELVREHGGIVALAHSTPMQPLFQAAPAVLGVTGTVTMEAVLAGKPVGVLGRHRMSRYPGVTRLESPAGIAGLVHAALRGEATVASPESAAALLSRLHAESYPGTMFDPLNQPELGTDANIADLVAAFRGILGFLATEWADAHDEIIRVRDAIVFDSAV